MGKSLDITIKIAIKYPAASTTKIGATVCIATAILDDSS